MEFRYKNRIFGKIQDVRPEPFEIKEIDLKKVPHCMSFGFDLEKYMKSIESVGVINSPLVVRNNKGRGVVPVTGYRRFMALKALEKQRVFCRDLTGCGFSDPELFILGLQDNLATRIFNDVEKGMILNGLREFEAADIIIESYMPLLGLPSRRSEFLFYSSLESDLSDHVKGLLVQGRISLKAIRMILTLDTKSRFSVAKVIANLKLNINKQRQFIEYLIDLSNMKGMKICDILNESEIKNLIFSENLNTPQKASALMRLIRCMRFPRLADAEKEFNKRIASLNLPKGVRISHPPFFESPTYSMEILFRDGKSLVERIENVQKISRLGELSDPWAFKGDEKR